MIRLKRAHVPKAHMFSWVTAWTLAAIVIAIAFVRFASAEEKPNIELRHVKIRVLDQEEKPVPNAEIIVWGLRTLKEGASGYGNPSRTQNSAKTGKDGVANVPYPRYVFEEMETGALTFNVVHEDFAEYEDQNWVLSEPRDIKLERGRRIQITLRNLKVTGVEKDDLFVITPISAGAWKIGKDDTLSSRPMTKITSPILVVGLPKDGPVQFSKFLDMNRLPKGDFRIRGIELSPGRYVKGRLSDDVPRPIKNGTIQLTVSGTFDKSPAFGNTAIWYDTVEIQPDGTFEFESAPNGFPVQFVAVCDGWVSVSRSPEKILEQFSYVNTLAHAEQMNKSITVAQEHDIDKVDEVVVQMEPTVDVEFEIVDTDDKPINGASISVSANTCVFPGPGSILGHFIRTKDQLRPSQPPEQPGKINRACFSTTNSEGYGVVRNIPKQRHSVTVWHEKYELPPDRINQFQRGRNIDLKKKNEKVKLKMQPKGKTVLGR